jgi:truncated hemoglobin YjbI
VELAEDFHEYKEEMKRFNHVIDQHMVETFSTEEVERIYYAYGGVNPQEGEKYHKELRLLIKKRTGNA